MTWRWKGGGMDELMTAAVLVRHGDQDAIEVREDWPVPVAAEGELVVRVAVAAVNNTDIWTRRGAYGLPGQPDALAGWRGLISFPRVQGGDIAGVVSAVGPGVSAGLVGRRVLVDPAIKSAAAGASGKSTASRWTEVAVSRSPLSSSSALSVTALPQRLGGPLLAGGGGR